MVEGVKHLNSLFLFGRVSLDNFDLCLCKTFRTAHTLIDTIHDGNMRR